MEKFEAGREQVDRDPSTDPGTPVVEFLRLIEKKRTQAEAKRSTSRKDPI